MSRAERMGPTVRGVRQWKVTVSRVTPPSAGVSQSTSALSSPAWGLPCGELSMRTLIGRRAATPSAAGSPVRGQVPAGTPGNCATHSSGTRPGGSGTSNWSWINSYAPGGYVLPLVMRPGLGGRSGGTARKSWKAGVGGGSGVAVASGVKVGAVVEVGGRVSVGGGATVALGGGVALDGRGPLGSGRGLAWEGEGEGWTATGAGSGVAAPPHAASAPSRNTSQSICFIIGLPSTPLCGKPDHPLARNGGIREIMGWRIA